MVGGQSFIKKDLIMFPSFGKEDGMVQTIYIITMLLIELIREHKNNRLESDS